MKITTFLSLLFVCCFIMSNQAVAQETTVKSAPKVKLDKEVKLDKGIKLDKEVKLDNAIVINLEGKSLDKEVKVNIEKEAIGEEICVRVAIASGQLIASIVDPNGIEKGGLRVSARENEKSKGILYETITIPGEWFVKITNDTGLGEVIINTRELDKIKEKVKVKEKTKASKVKEQ